jgi:hypothetical protein
MPRALPWTHRSICGAGRATTPEGAHLEDGTGLGELVLEQATLACFDAVPEILVRTLPQPEPEETAVRIEVPPSVSACLQERRVLRSDTVTQ